MFHVSGFKSQICSSKSGIVSLGITLLLGAIIVEIALVVALLAYLLNSSNYGIRLSAQALAAAQAGIDDGLLHLMRGDIYSGNTNPYSLSINGATVQESFLCAGGCPTPPSQSQQWTITSIAINFNRKRQLVAAVEVDAVTGLVKVQSINEAAL